jgi:hypothetical protein
LQELALIESMAALTLEPFTEFDNTSFLNTLQAVCRFSNEDKAHLLDYFISHFMDFADVRYEMWPSHGTIIVNADGAWHASVM